VTCARKLVAAGVLVASLVASSAAWAVERTLIVLLDSVPYDTMVRATSTRDAGGDGLFTDFASPIPLISTFPSSTSIALAGILGGLGLEPSPGYEARFFDWQQRRRRGGGPLSYFRVSFPWREFFDWNRKGPVRNVFHAAWPVRAGVREIAHAMAAHRQSDQSTFTIYVADTDTTAHLFGPRGLDPILAELDAQLSASELGRVILLSDHGLDGGEPLVNVLPAVRRAIRDRGWRWSRRLAAEGDVVFTPFGLVSSFEAYTEPSMAAELARVLAGVTGVDFCAVPQASGWRVEAQGTSLDVERRTGGAGFEWRWSHVGEDGVLLPVLASAGGEGEWVADADLLAATLASPYPDPLYRLAGAFEAVDNPASVICSVAAGYMYGARGTERSARWTKGRLRWTHGALARQASLGFLMTNRAAPAPGAIRFDEALDFALESSVPAASKQ